MNEIHDFEMQPELLTLKLADNHSITTKGSVRLRVCIQGREVTVPLHIVDIKHIRLSWVAISYEKKK